MKVLQLSTSDSTGGAGRAAFRIHQALRGRGIESKILCLKQERDDFHVIGPRSSMAKTFAIFRGVFDRFPIYFYRGKKTIMFYPQWLPHNIRPLIMQEAPDILHLHWICGGFIRLESLCRFNLPMIWTLHDMWAFTGGCHYSGDCTRYMEKCGRCPQLGSRRERDLSRWVWNRKKKVFNRLSLTIISPSQWLSHCALSSPLLKDCEKETIPYTLDLNRFSPIHRRWARDILNLPDDKKIILLGADNFFSVNRKGHQFIVPALKSIEKHFNPQDIHVVIFGASEPYTKPDISFKCHYFGTLIDDIPMSLLYAASDVFVIPSTQDNLPLTVMESLSSGTPVVAFRIGGIPDMVFHKKTGYLASPFDPVDLGKGIFWVITDQNRWKSLSFEARETAENVFSSASISERYIDLYEQSINSFKK